MRKFSFVLMALATIFVAIPSFALPQNLPHHNSSDVADWNKIFFQPSLTAFTVNSGGTFSWIDAATSLSIVETNSLSFSSLQMSATGSIIHMVVPLPDNTCVDCPIKLSVLWSTSDTTPTTDTATWKILYSAKALGEAWASASTALNTAITADAIDGDAYALQETPQGQINSGTLSRNDVLHLSVELNAASGLDPTSDTVLLHGIYLEYVREKI